MCDPPNIRILLKMLHCKHLSNKQISPITFFILTTILYQSQKGRTIY